MLKGEIDKKLYADYYQSVLDEEVRQAFSYIIGRAASLKSYLCSPGSHGEVKDFRLMKGSEWHFAFIPNQNWLLFYFRTPCQKIEKFSPEKIAAEFPEATKNNAGEFTIRVRNLESAVKIMKYIES